MSKFDSMCPECKKPLNAKDGKIPEHKIGLARRGRVVKVKCPGSGQTIKE